MATCRDTFGEPLTYKPVVGSPLSLKGIFHQVSELQIIDSQAELEGSESFVDFKASDLTLEPQRGDMIIASGKFFKVTYPEFDGYARYRIFLREFLPE